MKTVGIIGGMGPAATADLFMKMIACTEASRDGEHTPVIIDSNTAIPDRTAAILDGGASPLEELTRSAKRLEAAGAECLAMACNTAHWFYDDVAASVSVPVLHMPREAAKAARKTGVKRVAILSTAGTASAHIYDDAFALEAPEMKLLHPDEAGQQAITDMIYKCIKAGDDSFSPDAFIAAVDNLTAAGADVFVLGCTELPIAFERYGVKAPAIDPTMEIARALVAFSGATMKPIPNREIITADERAKTERAFFSSQSPLTLKSIPAREKKKRIVMERICEEIELNRNYTGPEFNEFLATIYGDISMLRRYLVDMGLVERDRSGSVYRRKS